MGKKQKQPKTPDYAALAKQDALAQQQLLDKQTLANRPNQITPTGESKWVKGADGQWTQTTSLAAPQQAQLNAQNTVDTGLAQTGQGLLGRAQNAYSTPLNTSGLPDWQKLDPSKLQTVDTNILDGPMGNSQAIQDATYKLLQPQRDLARQGEIQRLKNQGLTEDSPAFQRAIQRLDQGDTDAQLKSLIAGTQEYGNAYSRGMGQQQLARQLRSDQFGEQNQSIDTVEDQRSRMLQEQQNLRNSPLADIRALMGGEVQSPDFSSFAQSGMANAANTSAAADKSFQAQIDKYNAKQAGSAANGKLLGKAGAAIGSTFGPIGGALGGLAGNLLGGLF